MPFTSDDVKQAKPDALSFFSEKTKAMTWMAAIKFKGERHGFILTGPGYAKGKEFTTDEKACAWAKQEINRRLVAMIKKETKAQKKAKKAS
jgi:hypothetical protein